MIQLEFSGITKSLALMGDQELSATNFKRYGVSEFDLTLDGYRRVKNILSFYSSIMCIKNSFFFNSSSLQGFPLKSERESPIRVYQNFLQKTNRLFNPTCGPQIEISDFQKFHYLYCHAFNGEISDSGWIGATIKLEKAYEENMTLGLLKQLIL